MKKYLARNTPLAGLEQEMMLPPGSGSAISLRVQPP